jgi:hypothetical protein
LQSTAAYEKGTVSELAYDANPRLGYRIYIEEDGAYAPYAVVTADYGGNVLLVREHLLAKTMPFKENERHMWSTDEYGAYYADSSIDKYLNTEFYDTLGQSVKDAVVSSEIVITDKSSLGVVGETATTISRKVFLLSLLELTGMELRTSVSEGKRLRYFMASYKRRYAALPNGEVCTSWTRTPETWESYTVTIIGSKGTISAGGADRNNGVRPAFCLNKATEVEQRTDIVDGQKVYVIK